MDVFELVLIAALLGAGIGVVIYAARLLRRGDAVTAEEAVRWRRSARKQGFDASPDMNPDITDILVRAWRTTRGWYYLGLGVALLLAGACCGIYYALTIGHRPPRDWLFLTIFQGTLLAFYPGGLIGLVVGFAHVRREHEIGSVHPKRLRDYRPLFVALYPLLAMLASLVFAVVVVVRLAPELDAVSLARAFSLSGMWTLSVVPIIFLVVYVIGEIVGRWIVTRPSLSLPQDVNLRQRADDHLRRWALARLYSFLWPVVLIMTQGQLLALGASESAPAALSVADLYPWYMAYFLIMISSGMVCFASVGNIEGNKSVAAIRGGSLAG